MLYGCCDKLTGFSTRLVLQYRHLPTHLGLGDTSAGACKHNRYRCRRCQVRSVGKVHTDDKIGHHLTSNDLQMQGID
jgi:hypothetical protein